jgi:diadenosine tetraphosphate (Ap4A) HIT family hydrolase
MYDTNNIFAKILRGEIPCKRLYEDEYALAFPDIAPKAPVHVLVIPKGAYVSHDDFVHNADLAAIAGFERAVMQVVEMTGVKSTGYRLIANTGAHGGQEVPHYHVHVLGGKPLGAMLSG